MSTSSNLMADMVELRSRCATVIEERQAPIRSRQQRLRNLDLPSHEHEASRLVADASMSDAPEQLLDKAAELLMGDDKAALMVQLAEQAADLLDSKLAEIERKAGGLGHADLILSAIREQAIKTQISRVGQIGRSGLVDANLEKYLDANVGAMKTALAGVRDSMSDPRVAECVEQFNIDLEAFVEAVKDTQPA